MLVVSLSSHLLPSSWPTATNWTKTATSWLSFWGRTKNTTTPRRGALCYNCQKPGHVSANCSNRQQLLTHGDVDCEMDEDYDPSNLDDESNDDPYSRGLHRLPSRVLFCIEASISYSKAACRRLETIFYFQHYLSHSRVCCKADYRSTS